MSGGAALALDGNPSFYSLKVLEALYSTAWQDDLSGLFPNDMNAELYVGEGGAPQPVPTPAPPPGYWSISGSGCSASSVSGCSVNIRSNNYPGSYSNNEDCTVMLHETLVRVDALNTESNYDFLTIGGTRCCGSSGSSSGQYSGFIQWTTDFSVVNSGWSLCIGV